MASGNRLNISIILNITSSIHSSIWSEHAFTLQDLCVNRRFLDDVESTLAGHLAGFTQGVTIAEFVNTYIAVVINRASQDVSYGCDSNGVTSQGVETLIDTFLGKLTSTEISPEDASLGQYPAGEDLTQSANMLNAVIGQEFNVSQFLVVLYSLPPDEQQALVANLMVMAPEYAQQLFEAIDEEYEEGIGANLIWEYFDEHTRHIEAFRQFLDWYGHRGGDTFQLPDGWDLTYEALLELSEDDFLSTYLPSAEDIKSYNETLEWLARWSTPTGFDIQGFLTYLYEHPHRQSEELYILLQISPMLASQVLDILQNDPVAFDQIMPNARLLVQYTDMYGRFDASSYGLYISGLSPEDQYLAFEQLAQYPEFLQELIGFLTKKNPETGIPENIDLLTQMDQRLRTVLGLPTNYDLFDFRLDFLQENASLFEQQDVAKNILSNWDPEGEPALVEFLEEKINTLPDQALGVTLHTARRHYRDLHRVTASLQDAYGRLNEMVNKLDEIAFDRYWQSLNPEDMQALREAHATMEGAFPWEIIERQLRANWKDKAEEAGLLIDIDLEYGQGVLQDRIDIPISFTWQDVSLFALTMFVEPVDWVVTGYETYEDITEGNVTGWTALGVVGLLLPGALHRLNAQSLLSGGRRVAAQNHWWQVWRLDFSPRTVDIINNRIFADAGRDIRTLFTKAWTAQGMLEVEAQYYMREFGRSTAILEANGSLFVGFNRALDDIVSEMYGYPWTRWNYADLEEVGPRSWFSRRVQEFSGPLDNPIPTRVKHHAEMQALAEVWYAETFGTMDLSNVSNLRMYVDRIPCNDVCLRDPSGHGQIQGALRAFNELDHVNIEYIEISFANIGVPNNHLLPGVDMIRIYEDHMIQFRNGERVN